jgi:hypothetical protein
MLSGAKEIKGKLMRLYPLRTDTFQGAPEVVNIVKPPLASLPKWCKN